MSLKSKHPPDFLVWTDGSGHVSGFGGWACRVDTQDRFHKMFRMGAVIGTSVDRMEMTAILEALQLVMEMRHLAARDESDPVQLRPLKVKMFCDRENLVLSIQRVYDRSNCQDLWERFAYYEQRLEIDIEHVLRETDFPEFEMVDLHASTGFQMAKNYQAATDLLSHIVP